MPSWSMQACECTQVARVHVSTHVAHHAIEGHGRTLHDLSRSGKILARTLHRLFCRWIFLMVFSPMKYCTYVCMYVRICRLRCVLEHPRHRRLRAPPAPPAMLHARVLKPGAPRSELPSHRVTCYFAHLSVRQTFRCVFFLLVGAS